MAHSSDDELRLIRDGPLDTSDASDTIKFNLSATDADARQRLLLTRAREAAPTKGGAESNVCSAAGATTRHAIKLYHRLQMSRKTGKEEEPCVSDLACLFV